MIIRPGRETYINELLASDPLYLVDENHDLLVPAMSQFNENYQQRLRTYTINERQDQEILGKLPNGQFGLVFAYNFFNFRPFEVFKKYLSEIYQKLRPGGVLALTFNDCDRAKGVMLVEQHFCCYTPGYLVRELAQSLGYEIVFSWSDQGPSTWLELKKPGEFTSVRGGQALAKIIPK
jgi:SAM-dependent methyltransferase